MLALTIRTVEIWLLILAAAFANGLLRERLLIPRFGRRAGLRLSGVLLSAAVLAATVASRDWLGVRRVSGAVAVGVAWLALTLAFEFGFGRLRHKPWREILDAYRFRDGNLWPVVLLVTACAPAAVFLLGR